MRNESALSCTPKWEKSCLREKSFGKRHEKFYTKKPKKRQTLGKSIQQEEKEERRKRKGGKGKKKKKKKKTSPSSSFSPCYSCTSLMSNLRIIQGSPWST